MLTTIRVVSNTPPHDAAWGASDHWTNVFRYMSHDGAGRWNNLQLVDPRAEADWTVVVNHCHGHEQELIRDRWHTLVLVKEDHCVTCKSPDVWRYWGDPAQWGGTWTIERQWEPFDWWVHLPFGTLDAEHPEKTGILSAVQSAKGYHPNHAARVAFVRDFLAGVPGFDLWGRDPYPIAAYRGPLPGRVKDAGVLPYRYHFCAENYLQPNYWSEKLADAWVAECLPLYSGCPNLDDFFPPESYVRLDLSRPAEALAIVQEAITTDQYTKRLDAIREAKRLCLHKYNQWCCVELLLGG